jgi:peptidoglycan-associated lipoprotein
LAGVTPSAADSVEQARQLGLDGRARDLADRQLRLAEQTLVNRAAFVAAEKSAELQEELGVMVYFEVSSFRLQPAGRATLDRKVAILQDNPRVRLQIAGASDERGSARQNLALGNRRANAVKQYLVGKGIDPARLKEVSSGEKAPLESGRTEAAWARNRRVEFVIARGDVLLELR